MSSRWSWRAALSGIAVVAMTAATLVTAAPSQAFAFRGCKWGGTFGSSSALKYHFSSVTSGWVTAFNQGQYAWDTKAVPGYFVETTSSTTMNLLVRDYSMAADVWGYTSMPCSGGTYSDNLTVDFNSTAALAAGSMKLVAIHELGHAYGLGHVSNGCTDQHIGPAVMKSDATVLDPCGGNPPYADDVNGVNALY